MGAIDFLIYVFLAEDNFITILTKKLQKVAMRIRQDIDATFLQLHSYFEPEMDDFTVNRGNRTKDKERQWSSKYRVWKASQVHHSQVFISAGQVMQTCREDMSATLTENKPATENVMNWRDLVEENNFCRKLQMMEI